MPFIVKLIASMSPKGVQACAVCFGASDKPDLGLAFTWGIVILLSTTLMILIGLVYVVYRIEQSRPTIPGAS